MPMDTSGIIGGVRYDVYTLGGVGSGDSVNGVVRSSTLEGMHGVGYNRAGWVAGSAIAVSSSSGMVELKMSESWRRAYIWSSPSERKGDAGAGGVALP